MADSMGVPASRVSDMAMGEWRMGLGGGCGRARIGEGAGVLVDESCGGYFQLVGGVADSGGNFVKFFGIVEILGQFLVEGVGSGGADVLKVPEKLGQLGLLHTSIPEVFL